ncbi:protein kinase family protein [Nonomuraea sp. NPDC050404]|uniref:protein kinase family protein n=1 Tax=Nonomuraea sp. NPDC050404 TaxID=3155783 RepID=UPI0033F669C1
MYEREARLAAYGTVSTSLALLGDRELTGLLETAVPLGTSIGGTSARLEVEGTPVFVKHLTLTDLERLPGNTHSTANLFGMPPYCQYGIGLIGSPGWGAWRELAGHTMATNWTLAGRHPGFPLMYHWRVLPQPASALPDELADVDKVVAYWGGGVEIRRYLEALRDASASVTLFLEHFPHNLHDWLTEQVAAGGETAERACAMVERDLLDGVSFMNSRDLLHFDVHFGNILTDGRRLYFSDFGLSTSPRFALSREERDFLRPHRTYDRDHAFTYLMMWLSTALYGARNQEERVRLIRSWAGGERPAGVPEGIAAMLTRYSPLAEVMLDFYHRFQNESRKTPYPVAEIEAVSPPAP